MEGIKAYGVVTVVAISLLWLETGLAGLFTAMVVWEFAVFAGLQTMILREIGIALPAFDEFRQYLEYSIPVAISSLASNATSRIDRVVIGVFLGASAVGVYSVTYQIAIAVKMYVSPIRQAFFPEFSELIDQEEIETCGKYLRTGLRAFLLIALPSVGGLYLIGPEVLDILTSGSGVPSSVLIAVIGLGLVWQGVDQIYGVALRAAEDTGYRAKVMGVGAGANLLANLLLVPTFGIMGAAIATLMTYLLLAGLTIKRVKKHVPVRFPMGSIVRCSIATLVMVVIAPFVGLEALWQIVLLSVVCYTTSLFLSRELTVTEIRSQLLP